MNGFIYTFQWQRGTAVRGGGSCGNWKNYTNNTMTTLLVSYGMWHMQVGFCDWSKWSSVNRDHDSTHDGGDTGVVISTIWCRQLAQQSSVSQLLSIIGLLLTWYLDFINIQLNEKLSSTINTEIYNIFLVYDTFHVAILGWVGGGLLLIYSY